MTYFSDLSVLAGVSRRESDGAMIADVRVARTGVQLYRGSEIDPKNEHGLRDRATVRVYRPGTEVFSEDTMKSLAHRPVTNDHPPEMVSADNWKKYAVGQTADEIKGEGIYLRVPMMISDGDTIKLVENGKRELSSGYWSEIDWSAGKTADGESYDVSQKNIRFNHVAVVRRGRAGSEVRIGDEAAWGISPTVDDGEDEGVHTMANTRTVTVDGISIEVPEQGAQVIEKLQTQVKSLVDAAATAETTHKAALADRDKQLATKDAENDKLKTQVLDAAAIDKLVLDRTTLVTRAAKVVKDVKTAGVSAIDIKKSVVLARLGDAAVKDKSDVYIEARFDALVEDAEKGEKKDDFRDASRDGFIAANDANKGVQTAYDKMVEDLRNPTAAKVAG